jgi:DNA-binding response OmpR family regulator
MKTVLVVDDIQDIRTLVSIALRQSYNVLTAEDGKKALNIFKKNKIDLIILDIMLPEISGLNMLKEFKKQSKKVKVLLLTAVRKTSSENPYAHLGADAYMEKPVKIGELRNRVKKLIG